MTLFEVPEVWGRNLRNDHNNSNVCVRRQQTKYFYNPKSSFAVALFGTCHRLQDKMKLSTPSLAISDENSTSSGCGCDVSNKLKNLDLENDATIILARKHFLGAISGADTLAKVAAVLPKYGFDDDNTLFAQSVCPDEINHEEGDITDLFTKHLGEVFHMGGLGGLPFTGKTGFGAFSHHVPDNGHCFVLMAPHIGISEAHELGMYTRDGQSCSGAACGAAGGALKHCYSGKPIPSLTEDPSDYQMNFIIHAVNDKMDQIMCKSTNNEQQASLAHEVWGISKDMLDNVVSTNFGSDKSKLMLLTGIQINMPRPHNDYFQPLTFEVHMKDGTVIDLFEDAFGIAKPKVI
jgi:hypothetical protein